MKLSMRSVIVCVFVVILASVAAGGYSINRKAASTIREEVSSTNSQLLSMYTSQIDQTLNETRKKLIQLADKDFDIATFSLYAIGDSPYAEAAQRISNRFGAEMDQDSAVDSLFAYSTVNQEMVLFTSVSTIYEERYKLIRGYMPYSPGTGLAGGDQWRVVPTSRGYALLGMVNADQRVVVGAFINIGNLVDSFHLLHAGSGAGTVVMSGDGSVLSNTVLSGQQLQVVQATVQQTAKPYQSVPIGNDSTPYLLIANRSKYADLTFVYLLPEQAVMGNLVYLKKLLLAIPFAGAALIAACLWILLKLLFRPMYKMMDGIRGIVQGNRGARLTESGIVEYRSLGRAFNVMAAQIEGLKISVYEEQLRVQQAEYKRLQAQINPHFFVNSLNVAHSFISLGRNGLAAEMLEHLAEYYRYIVRTDSGGVTLEEEMQLVRSYLEIQRMRYMNRLDYSISVPEPYALCLIPQLTLLTLIENCLIHGFKEEEPLFIALEVSALERESGRYLLIEVADNGNGFSTEALEQLAHKRFWGGTGRDHIGIWNVYRRMLLEYEEGLEMEFRNREPGGAEVRLRIPVAYGRA
ncbi:MAG: sensor histidine kinase [Paenibacillaceae bacterium]|jgi:two-component system sensor histidine kinase YesM|nr:sensor histidine kinase [Paenibacillaceae bacterium]